MKLSRIIDLQLLQEIQDCFCKATGFAAVTVDYRGKPLLQYSRFCRFCAKLREDPYYNERCRQSDAHGSLEAVRRNAPYIYKCHAGLIDFAIPIIVDGEYVASMLCGQVRAEEAEEDNGTPEVETDLIQPTRNLFIDRPELQGEFDKVIVVPMQRIRETANLLSITLNHIVGEYLLNQKIVNLTQGRARNPEMEKRIMDLEFQHCLPRANPHFLLNALNAASRQAYLENAPKTQDILFALADMYRSYPNDSSSLVFLEQELNHLDHYIFIQKARFGAQLEFSTDIPESIRYYMLPAITLQILVENAILHGLEPKEGMGKVHVGGVEIDGKLILEVTDEGAGMPPKLLDLLNDRTFAEKPPPEIMGTGIYYLLKRLQYFYPGAFELRFSNVFPAGVHVWLSLPAETGRRGVLREEEHVCAT